MSRIERTATADAPPIESLASPLHEASPIAFLRACGGAPRGFWSHGEDWVAFAGSALTLQAEPGQARFAAIRAAARAIRVAHGRGEPAPRLFGGFRFADAPSAGAWAAFPGAAFVLPALELHSRGTGAMLVTREAPESDPARASTAAALADHLRENPSRRVPSRRRSATVVPLGDDAARWHEIVRDALAAISRGSLEKVVVARTLDVTATIDPLDVLDRVRCENPSSTVFYFEPTAGAVFVGAAPEIVVALNGTRCETTVVAGTMPRGRDVAEDQEFARTLMKHPKERREHAIGVRDLASRLAPLTNAVDVDAEPHVLPLAHVQHLETHMRATVPAERHVLEILEALHPTAAVCGFPRENAAAFLTGAERFDRGWYAGPVGWFGLNGDGVFAPGLRSAVGRGERWRLYAGAGIVAGSDPDREWEETRVKFEPMLRALGAGDRG